MNNKVALITGITGQDGSYLAEFLLEKGYEVHGIKRRASSFNTERIDHIYADPHQAGRRFILHYGDLTDSTNLIRIIQEVQPDEIYNLAAQSHVAVSFEEPEYTANADALGTLRLLEAIRILGLEKKTRFYQASTSELYGLVQETPQKETTPFYPRSPYAVAKLYSYWITVNYREAYGLYGCNGILFNHESPRRGETFVTRKITRALARIKLGLQNCLYLGNMNALRDWGHAKDYVEMQWLMLQQDTPDDYVIATGVQYSVREFVTIAAAEMGMQMKWHGEGLDEKGYDQNGQCIVQVDPRYFRPTEVETLLGDPSKAHAKLGWKPRITFAELVQEMVREDLKIAQRDALIQGHGYRPMTYHEYAIKKNARIYIAGHRGLVGSALLRKLEADGYSNLVTRTHGELDLTDPAEVEVFFSREKPDYVFLAAARVGGILANDTYPAEFIRDNLAIQTNIIHSAYSNRVERLLFLGSSCIYPKLCPQPMKEEYLLTGPLEPTNRPYALAKIAGIEQCWSYNRQYGTKYLAVMPTNLYGPGDNYHPENSHVIPALIRKFHEAKVQGHTTVTVWGTGTPRREFLYSEDMAAACTFLMDLPDEQFLPLLGQNRNDGLPPLINIGAGHDLTIRELATIVKDVIGYPGEIIFDSTKPDGAPRKLLDISRLGDLGWQAGTNLGEGLVNTYANFKRVII